VVFTHDGAGVVEVGPSARHPLRQRRRYRRHHLLQRRGYFRPYSSSFAISRSPAFATPVSASVTALITRLPPVACPAARATSGSTPIRRRDVYGVGSYSSSEQHQLQGLRPSPRGAAAVRHISQSRAVGGRLKDLERRRIHRCGTGHIALGGHIASAQRAVCVARFPTEPATGTSTLPDRSSDEV
jgi:hypothetical protein